MFTWECPTCGRDLDVSLKTCPDCAAAGSNAPQGDVPQPNAEAAANVPPVDSPSPSSPAKKLAAASPPSAFSLTPKHLLLFVFLLGGAVAAAIFLARPELLPEPKLPVAWREPGPVEQPGRGNNDPLEIAGIRLTESEEGKPVVRAVIVNHGAQAVRKASMAVALREFGAPVDAPPEVAFTLQLEEELEAGASREVDVPLEEAPDSGLPRWGRLRVDVRRLAN